MNYLEKDLKKFNQCNKMISYWVVWSSSYEYQKDIYKDIVNQWKYYDWDIIWISINWNRKNRMWIEFYIDELNKMKWFNVKIIVDKKYDRYRSYNIWERELEKWLIDNWYIEIIDWTFKQK